MGGDAAAVAPLFARTRLRFHSYRTTLYAPGVLRDDLLEEATRLAGERTYSRTIERALEDFVRRAKVRQILELAGSGLWIGDLPEMRADGNTSRKKGKRVPG